MTGGFGKNLSRIFVAATDQIFAYDLVMGAISHDVAPLFPVAGATATGTDVDVEPLFRR